MDKVIQRLILQAMQSEQTSDDVIFVDGGLTLSVRTNKTFFGMTIAYSVSVYKNSGTHLILDKELQDYLDSFAPELYKHIKDNQVRKQQTVFDNSIDIIRDALDSASKLNDL